MDKRKALLSEVQAEYEQHCKARRLAPETIVGYSGLLRIMVRTLGDIPVWSLSHKHVDQIFASQSWTESSRNNRLGQLRAFFAWCRARGYMHRDNDPTFSWRMMPVPNKQRQRIPVQEWGRLFNACIHPQERIVLATGLYLFLRSSEQKRIQLKHINLAQGEVLIYRSKTKQWDLMPITSELHDYLTEHMTMMAQEGWTDPEHYLIGKRGQLDVDENNQWVAGTGKMTYDKPFYRPHIVVQRILNRAGYPHFREGEHTLRRSGARAYFDALVDQGYDGALRRVQSMLGHKESSMTERYLGIELEQYLRNRALSRQAMFPSLQDESIVPMVRKVSHG